MSYNSLEVTVNNFTGQPMELRDFDLEEGIAARKPGDIPNNGNTSFLVKSCNRATNIAGLVNWVRHSHHHHHIRDDRSDPNDPGSRGAVFGIKFNKPGGDRPTKFLVTSPDEFRYVISGDPLDQHAEVTVSFYRQTT